LNFCGGGVREGRVGESEGSGRVGGGCEMKNISSHSLLNFGSVENDFRISDYPIAVIINCEQGIGRDVGRQQLLDELRHFRCCSVM